MLKKAAHGRSIGLFQCMDTMPRIRAFHVRLSICMACHVDVCGFHVRTSRSQQPKDPQPVGVVKFRSESAFVHAENSAHSVTPGNFGLNLSCDNLSLERYR